MDTQRLHDYELTDDERHDLIYGHPMHYIQAQTSAAHTYGNVTAFVQNWLINLFPKDFFKTIHVNSKIAHAQMRSTPKEFLKKQPPMFVIRPRIDWDDDSRFLRGTPLVERQGDLYMMRGGTNLQDFIWDRNSRTAIKYQMNRSVLNFDVILIFNTMIQQINWANYFKNSVRYEIPFNLQTCLESYIPPDLLAKYSELIKVPMRDENGSTAKFLKHLNSTSVTPITYKLEGATGHEEFYRYYPVNIDTIITNFNVDEGDKINQVGDTYKINFSMRCEFYSTGFYYIFSDDIKENSIVTCDDSGNTIVPIFTDVLTEDDVNLPLGWTLYASPSCRLEQMDDEVDLSTLFNDSLKKVLNFHFERGIPTTDFFKMKVRKQGRLMTPDKDYSFDFNTLTLKFHHQSTYYTYKIIIQINVDYINNLIKEIYHLV